MGVYIKGMEMPQDGSWITVRIYPDGTCGRPDAFGDCSLYNGVKAIPVPPHGRLIDGDLLPWKLANYPFKCASYDDWEKLCDGIAKAPTVIESESVQNSH